MTAEDFKSKYGPWALVTGAARGLGAEFARQVAERGLDVVLVDLLADEVAGVAKEIGQSTGRDARAIAADLSNPGFIDKIRQETEGVEIGLLICNAGIARVGPFFDVDLEAKMATVAVNVQSPLILVHEMGAKMRERERGGIILLSSASALQGTALSANYAATKAYNLILAESLWDELRREGVDVLGFMPGPTNTPGYADSSPRLELVPQMKVMEARETVAEALDALGEGPSHIAGKKNRRNAFLLNRLMSRRRATGLVGKTMRACYGKR
ncbi:MAG: SDR family NAD(P)-dependent oxidoreductase [Dehalococcoidia bacterium]